MIQFLDAADCLYEVIGQSCGPVVPPLYSDNFETNTGWTVNANGTDTATTGQLAAGQPGWDELERRQAARHDDQRRQ